MFSKDMGFAEQNQIQVQNLDEVSRIRISNFIENLELDGNKWRYVVDRLGRPIECSDISNYQVVIKLLRDGRTEWYKFYDVLEILHDVYSEDETGKKDYSKALAFQTGINNLMKELKTEYKMQNGRFIRIGSEVDGEEIRKALNTSIDVVRNHIDKALDSYSRREKPDYENAEKEAVMALESLANVLAGKKQDLNKAIDEMEKRGMKIHPALRDAIKKIYAYAGDEDGVRHGGIETPSVDEAEARLIVVMSSVIANYMTAKFYKDEG